MRRVQALGLALTAAAAVVTLTGCEKPPPQVSVFSGSHSIHTDAACWAFEGEQLEPGQCAEEVLSGNPGDGVATLPVQGGNVVGISVDEAVAEAGWTIVLEGQPATPEMTTTYFRFPLNPVLQQDMPIQVVAGREGRIKGVWNVKLTPQLD